MKNDFLEEIWRVREKQAANQLFHDR